MNVCWLPVVPDLAETLGSTNAEPCRTVLAELTSVIRYSVSDMRSKIKGATNPVDLLVNPLLLASH